MHEGRLLVIVPHAIHEGGMFACKHPSEDKRIRGDHGNVVNPTTPSQTTTSATTAQLPQTTNSTETLSNEQTRATGTRTSDAIKSSPDQKGKSASNDGNSVDAIGGAIGGTVVVGVELVVIVVLLTILFKRRRKGCAEEKREEEDPKAGITH
ncbi:hypothetical protein AC249_AIPGENE28347 [Exaiptasia diaphana]|nr:hypothetical protein AC249_AIPGENE28347 [Exaiptasia diaphana]